VDETVDDLVKDITEDAIRQVYCMPNITKTICVVLLATHHSFQKHEAVSVTDAGFSEYCNRNANIKSRSFKDI